MEGKNNEDEEDDQVNFLGLSFTELFFTGNALLNFSLGYMSLFARSYKLPYDAKHSFVEHYFKRFENESFPLFQVDLVQVFFSEASSTRGGKLVVDSLYLLSTASILSALITLSQKKTERILGLSLSWALFGLLPLLCAVVGVSSVFPLFLTFILQQKRRYERVWDEKEEEHELNSVKVMCSIPFVLSSLGLQYAWMEMNVSVLWFLLVPSLFPLCGWGFSFSGLGKDVAVTSSRFRYLLVVVLFLFIGTCGVIVHTVSLQDFNENPEMLMDVIVTDCLTNSPSRFMFVQFMHLLLTSVMYAKMEMPQAATLVFLAIAIVAGPCGSFALLAANHFFLRWKSIRT